MACKHDSVELNLRIPFYGGKTESYYVCRHCGEKMSLEYYHALMNPIQRDYHREYATAD